MAKKKQPQKSETISTNFRISRARHARLARLSKASRLSMTAIVELAIDEAVKAWRAKAVQK